MSVKHHPSDELLLDYASGALDEGWSLAVATHLALCPDSRQRVSEIEAIGASFMESLSPTPLLKSSCDSVFSRLSTEDVAEDVSVPSGVDNFSSVFPSLSQ